MSLYVNRYKVGDNDDGGVDDDGVGILKLLRFCNGGSGGISFGWGLSGWMSKNGFTSGWCIGGGDRSGVVCHFSVRSCRDEGEIWSEKVVTVGRGIVAF